jgi:membrane protease YdiL (CAAX protease family)
MTAHGSNLQEPEIELSSEPVQPSFRAPGKALRQFWQRVFAAPLGRVEDETRAYLATEAARGPDWKVMIVLVTVAVCLAIQKYLSMPALLGLPLRLLALFAPLEALGQTQEALLRAQGTAIGHLFYWCLTCLLTYFVIPSLVIRFILKERIRDYGVKLKGAFAGFWLYAMMLAIMLPLVVLVSRDVHFQDTYPFYPVRAGEALWPTFWRWEVLYALQFLALEFFFRGFMVQGLRRRFGIYSVFAMMVPYCMIHFGKPVQETFAAIVAGIVLGFMSLKTRSIWMGAVLHVSVALSMDFSSLWRKGFFSS